MTIEILKSMAKGHDALIAAQATAAENKRVLDELATMYENVPDRFLDGTYRLHSEWRDKIESLRAQPEPKDQKQLSDEDYAAKVHHAQYLDFKKNDTK